MCGRFTLTRKQLREVAEAMGAKYDPEMETVYRARFNIAPSDTHWIFRNVKDTLWLKPAIWGLHPHWLKRKEGFINTRIETAAEKPAFRDAVKKRRCVIPADGFYEWSATKSGKQPYWFARDNREVFLFAGLFEETKEEDVLPTFSILTTQSKAVLSKYHDRMPVILNRKAAEEWIVRPPPADPKDLESLLAITKHNESDLEATPVSKRVNSPKFDEPVLLEPISL